MKALNKQAHQTENERMDQSLAERNGEPVEGLRQRISELEEIATDYGMKFQKAQDALKHQALLHKSQLEAAESYAKDRDEENQGLMLAVGRLRVEREASEAKLKAAENNLIDSECHVAELEESLRDKQALLEAAEKRIAEQREYYEGVIADGSRRIAELEARDVKLPNPISVLHRRDFNDAHREIYAYPEAEVNAALAAAGIGVKGE